MREDAREEDVFSLIGPKKYDVPWKALEKQGRIAQALCSEIRVRLPEDARFQYAISNKRDKFRIASTNPNKEGIVETLIERHKDDNVLVIGQYLDQLKMLTKRFKAPLITGRGTTPIPLQIIWADDNRTSVANAKAIYRDVSKPREKASNQLLTMSKMDGSRNSPTGLLTDGQDRDKCFKFIADEIKFRILDNQDLLTWQNREGN